jgi:hypothetical protein
MEPSYVWEERVIRLTEEDTQLEQRCLSRKLEEVAVAGPDGYPGPKQ